MNMTVEIPDDLVGQLNAADGDLSRRALEALALEEYKSGHITKAELRRLPGFDTRYELDGFLKAREVWADYSIEDLRREIQDLQSTGL
jgi:predicted HTH domain antitoxin